MRHRSHVRQTRPPHDRYTSDDHQKKLISDVQPSATGCWNMRGRRDGDDAGLGEKICVSHENEGGVLS